MPWDSHCCSNVASVFAALGWLLWAGCSGPTLPPTLPPSVLRTGTVSQVPPSPWQGRPSPDTAQPHPVYHICFIVLHGCCIVYKIKVCSNPTGAIFPSTLAHFVSASYSRNFHNISNFFIFIFVTRYLHCFLRYNGVSCILNRLQSSVTITFICAGKPANLCDLLFCSALEPNLQHLQGVPVFVECVKTCLQRIMEQVGHVEISRCQLRRHQEGRAKRTEGSQPNSICLWGGPTEVP